MVGSDHSEISDFFNPNTTSPQTFQKKRRPGSDPSLLVTFLSAPDHDRHINS